MVGKRDANLRKGDLAEGIGRELLRRFAAVASVPREEDFGIDAVCTLLRADEARNLYAENSFAVQFKSASVRTMPYEGEAARWLRQLDIPLLIGSVDLARAELTLYSTENAFARYVHARVPYDLILCLDGGRVPADPRRAGAYLLRQEKGVPSIWLGTPLLHCSILDAGAPEFPAMAYRALKPWLDFSAESRRLRSFGVHREVSVDGANPPVTMSWYTGSEHGDLDRLLDALNPLLYRLSTLLGHGFDEGPLLAELRTVRDFMRARRIDPIGAWDDPPAVHDAQAPVPQQGRVMVSFGGARLPTKPEDPAEGE